MVIIESQSEAEQLVNALQSEESLVIPVFTDAHAHPAVNTLALLYFQFASGQVMVLPLDHCDTINTAQFLPAEMPIGTRLFTPDKKRLMHASWLGNSAIDLKGVEFIENGTVTRESTFYTLYMREMYEQFRHVPNINRIIPLMQLIVYCEAYAAHLTTIRQLYRDDAEFQFHNSTVLPATFFMERSGIHVTEQFKEFYSHVTVPSDGLLYTEYNPYTTTHRVTSKFGGVNFAALNKTNGEREVFTSRFPQGKMVLMDFESFHIRLMAQLIGYELPNEPIHTFFARQYFDTSDPTPEQYDNSKKLTFRFLYSTQREGSDIPFFARVYDFIDEIWEKIQQTGELTTNTGMRVRLSRIEDPNPSKVFNYLLQLTEMEVTMAAINGLQSAYTDVQSKIVLYTYDSLLIDYNLSDGKAVLTETRRILEQNGRYPVRVYVGSNYNCMNNVSDIVKT